MQSKFAPILRETKIDSESQQLINVLNPVELGAKAPPNPVGYNTPCNLAGANAPPRSQERGESPPPEYGETAPPEHGGHWAGGSKTHLSLSDKARHAFHLGNYRT